MAAIIETLKKWGNIIYPNTKVEAVYDNSGNRLDGLLDGKVNTSDVDAALSDSSTHPVQNKIVKSAIDTVSTNLGSPSTASAVSGANAFAKISTLNSDLASMLKSKRIEIGGLSFTAGSVIDLGTMADVMGITGFAFNNVKGLSLLMAGGQLNYDFGKIYAVKTNNHFFYWPSTSQSGGYVYFTVLY